MKKNNLFFVTILILLFGNFSGQTVYITKTGKKYHEQSCRYLNKSTISINLSDAINKGYSSCSVCNPPTSASTTSDQKNKSDVGSNQNASPTTSSQQCGAKTKDGSRCKRMTKSSNGFCWQHGGS